MTLASLMQTFAENLGQEDLTLTEDGSAQIVFDDVHEVDICTNEGRPGFGFSATVGPLPEEAEEATAVCLHLLEANLLGDATNGAALALDSERGEIVLCRNVNQDDIAYEAFEAELSAFLAALRHWKGHDLTEDPDEDPAGDEEAPTDDNVAAAAAAMFRV